MPARHSRRYDVSQMECRPCAPFVVMMEAHDRARRERRAARDAAVVLDPEFEAVLARFEAIGVANDDVPAAPSLKPDLVTKRPSRRLKKSSLRDRKDRSTRMAYRRIATGAAEAPAGRPLAEHPITPSKPITKPTTSITKPTTKRTKARKRHLATWEEAGDLTRLDYINAALMVHGWRYAFTLNLAPDVIAAANDNARGPHDAYHRAIARALARVPPPQGELMFWLVTETTGEGRQHLHAAVAVPCPDLLPAIEEALVRVGGWWRGPGREYQLDLEPQRHPAAWSAYPLKRQARTRRHIREATGLDANASVRIASWSRGLVPKAKRLLAEERRAIGRV